jgi:hypothetical protein
VTSAARKAPTDRKATKELLLQKWVANEVVQGKLTAEAFSLAASPASRMPTLTVSGPAPVGCHFFSYFGLFENNFREMNLIIFFKFGPFESRQSIWRDL